MIRGLIKKLLAIVTHMQVVSVFFAFALMVFLSYYFMSNIERSHLLKNVDNLYLNTQTHIEAALAEPETALFIITESIRNMILRDFNQTEVNQYIKDTADYFKNDERFIYNTGIYGYFDVFGGAFLSSEETPGEINPQEQLWFKAAVDAHGSVGVTEPVVNKENNSVSITFSRRIFGNDGLPLGIICLDMRIDKICDYAVNVHVTENSYGILFDRNFDVIAHPKQVYIGGNILMMNDGALIKKELLEKGAVSEKKVMDHNNNDSVGFIKQLNNGWYLGIITYSDIYYKSVKNIGYFLVALGAIFATLLCAILLNMFRQKKKAEERTKIMFDATPLCANFWDSDLNLIDCNNEALNLFNITNKKEYINNINDLSPEYQPDGSKSSEKAFDFLKKACDEGYLRFDWMYRKFTGELIPCEVTLVRVKSKSDLIICEYIRDLREIKTMMAKMREADECTQVLFDTTPLSCFMINNSMKIVECNQEIVRLFGISDKTEFINQLFDFFPEYQPSGEKSKDFINKHMDEAFEDGYCRFECMHNGKSGNQIPTEVTLVRVKFKGEYAVAGYIRDLREIKAMIAEMRRAEVAEESSKAKSDFLAKMSHEIRTPMNAILGITEIQLQDNSLPLVTKEALERIYNSGDLLLGIINDILDLSKIEAGKLELISRQYEIASLIHDTVKLNIMRYESKPIEFKLIVSEKVPSTLIGDELRIKQILNNLLSNAYKYTHQGQIELTLSSEKKDGNSVDIIIRVSDTGQGMTEEQVKRLGDKFSRFNLDANRNTEGTGLGMNITRNLIQLMNGSIEIESTPGMGSVFTVTLPQITANTELIGKELSDNLMKLNLKNTIKIRNAQITQEFMPYGRVLVVDDVETNLYVARGLMAPYGLSIDTALSGFEAIDKIRDGAEYDIVFMDHMMPRMDGIEAAKLIRNTGYIRPIVALTANALAGQAEMFIQSGFDDFISKPIDIRQLNSVLNKMIRDKQTPEVLEEARRQKNSLYAAGGHNIAIDDQLAEFFVRDAKKAVNILNALSENKCRRSDDMAIFIINIHAMKSALANVGETELSNKAAELEQAGRDQNINLILSSLPGFIDSLNGVIEKLKPYEEDEKEDEVLSPENVDYVFLQEKLRAIQNACASYNKKTAKEALAALKQKHWPHSTRDKLSAIAEHLLHSEFDEAAAIAREINASIEAG
ncbi:MAG: ATP-binding protein [Treponema sp.]|nr:ATP-binding protein [Treponema sp.]